MSKPAIFTHILAGDLEAVCNLLNCDPGRLLPLTFPAWRFTLEAMLTVFPTLARLFWRHIAVVALLAATLVNSSFADEAEELYLKSVKPMLAEKCFACHGVLKAQAGLRLDTVASMVAGGDSGPAIVPGKPHESLILKAVAGSEELSMPPEGEGAKLKPEEMAMLRQWIDQGAPSPTNESPQENPREFWSYRPVARPMVPNLSDVPAYFPLRSPIDYFVAAEHQRRNLLPAPATSPETWLRRVHLDLTGLPPTAAECAAFLDDFSEAAYERVVDDLLSRPTYGQRWGRHWMDVWRYSDWYGSRGINEVRYGMRHIWHWRNWIVDSLNRDDGYDRMISMMLAGDELLPDDEGALAATGYLGRNWYKFDRNVWMFDAVEKTAEALTATTLRCARCHDHKYDPISQEEYYRFRAIFEPHQVRTERLSLDAPMEKDATLGQVLAAGIPRVFDQAEDSPTYLFVRGDDRSPDKSKALSPGTPAAFGVELNVSPVSLPAPAWYPALRPKLRAEHLAQANKKVDVARLNLAAAQQMAEQATAAVSQPPANAGDQQPWLADNFDKLDSDKWKVTGMWASADSKLIGKAGASLESKTLHPMNFRLRMKYRTFAIGPFRSIGFSYDQAVKGDSHEIYTSVNEKQPSVQAFHRVAGKDHYPAEGVHPLPLKIGEPITLEVEVRGVLVSVSVDGEKRFDYLLPVARRAGNLVIWIYDGEGELDEIEITPLAVSSESLTLAAIDALFESQKAKLATEAAVAELAALEARLNADASRYGGQGEAEWKPLTQHAAKATKLAAALSSNESVLHWEHHVAALQKAAEALPVENKSRGYAIPMAEKQLAQAKEKLAEAKATAEIVSDEYPPVGERFHNQSTGRRTALAKWLTDPKNPRTSRVAVNHLWLRHFGEGFVSTPNNFGLNGQRPVMPELFEWLAAELIAHQWHMKPIHRQIVLSTTYRQSSAESTEQAGNRAIDPENRMLWRMTPRRLEAEVIRDSLLALGGTLDISPGQSEIPESDGNKVMKRSMYFRNTPNEKMAMLEVFDVADPNACFRRKESVVPQQALALMNSGLAQDQSRILARKLSMAVGDAEEKNENFVNDAFVTVLCRQPTDREKARCITFLSTAKAIDPVAAPTVFAAGGESAIAPSPPGLLRAREQLVHVLLCHAEFVTMR